jgi:hypothetical protein
MPSRTALRSLCLSLAAGFGLATLLLAIEYFAVTRFDGNFIPVSQFKAERPMLLALDRQRGTLVQLTGRGFMSAAPGVSQAEVSERLRARFPNEYDPKKVTWILTDEEGAFFYLVSPRWPALGALALVSALFFAPYIILRGQARYQKGGRLADVLALLQILALQDKSARSEDGLRKALQGPPRSAKNWKNLSEAHPEFFRVSESADYPISLLIRFAAADTGTDRGPLSPAELQSLMSTAVLLHERELALLQRWQVWVPIVSAVVAGLFALATTS